MHAPLSAEELRRRRTEIVEHHGPWTAHTIHLGEGVYTDEDRGRIEANGLLLRRIVQVVSDLSKKPLGELRILDLACLEGMYGIELARQGATVLAIEAREEHIAKAQFAARVLGLDSFRVIKDDVRNLSLDLHGSFDFVLCLGILYHLDAPDVFDFLGRIAAVCTQAVIIDTHVALGRGASLSYKGRDYRGRRILEHLPWKSRRERARKPWASLDNTWSVWLTPASLFNALQDAGFTSVFECELPAMPGRHENRRTVAAVKGAAVQLASTPSVNDIAPATARDISSLARVTSPYRWVIDAMRMKIRHLTRK